VMVAQKMKLNPECKRSLFNQAMQLRSPSNRQIFDGTRAFKFLKLLQFPSHSSVVLASSKFTFCDWIFRNSCTKR